MAAIKWVLKYTPTPTPPGGSNMYFSSTPVLNSAVLFNSVGDAISIGVNYRTCDAFHNEAVVMQVDVEIVNGDMTVTPSRNVADQPLPPKN